MPARRPLPSTLLCNQGRDGSPVAWGRAHLCHSEFCNLGQLLSLSKPPSSHLQNGHSSHFPKFSRGFINIRHISRPAPCWRPDVVTARQLLLKRSVVSNSLQPHGLYPARLLCPCNSPGQNTGVGCYFLLQGIFLIQGSREDPH